ncbi:MAG: indole-3-glycerol phosphate synthase TrpC [Planctomycetes bacterium]|nr:indole-3-glycerol phosphate synthase TrpC [Planctomycetota bacterium]
MSDILADIVSHKRQEIAAAKIAVPEAELRARLATAPPPRDFFGALAAAGPVALIAEVKKASPSVGLIRADFNPASIAQTYERHGAEIPILRKDFVIDAYQLLEARAAGADAVLLIAECLDDCLLRGLHAQAIELGMTPLVELYEPANLQRVFDAGATLIGVNNRDLRTFKTDLEHVIRLRAQVPDQCLLVAESGIHTAADVARLRAAGIDAMLVGESLMRSKDIGAAMVALLN